MTERWHSVSLRKNNILYACVPHYPLRQERNADLIPATVPPLPPLPGALIKHRNQLSAWSSWCQCNAMWSVWPGAENIWEIPQNSTRCQSTQCHWHSMRQLYIQSVPLKYAAAAQPGIHFTEYSCEILICGNKSVKRDAALLFKSLNKV